MWIDTCNVGDNLVSVHLANDDEILYYFNMPIAAHVDNKFYKAVTYEKDRLINKAIDSFLHKHKVSVSNVQTVSVPFLNMILIQI